MNLQNSTYFKINNTQLCFRTATWEYSRSINRFITACLAIILLNEQLICAQKEDSLIRRKNPFHIQLQYAGNLGLGSIGIGKSFFNENFSLTAIYGYLPEKINTIEVHTIALKTCLQIVKFTPLPDFQLSLYSGINFMYGLTENTFVKLPSWYPEEYYPPIALHASAFLGLNHNLSIDNWKWTNLISVFTEIGAIDYQVYNAIKNKNVHFSDVVNLSAGISLKLARIKK